MDRKKRKYLVITFPTTTAAMAMDAACGAEMGRLIPIPGEIHGGCGLAWCADPALESLLLEKMNREKIPFQEKQIVELY